MTAVATATADTEARMTVSRFRPHDIWRIVRLHAVNPSVFFGVPWIILGAAWIICILVALIITGGGAPADEVREGMRYSWAVLSPQWYLVAVGVQAVAYTLPFALGFGATRRDYWLGTSAMFVLVSFEMAVAIATLVQLEQLTNGWWVGAGMFDALWYGQHGWWFDFFSTFAFQLMVLFLGASITTIFMRWRMKGTLTLLLGGAVLLIAAIAALTFTQSWPNLLQWFVDIGVTGVFTIVFGLAVAWAIAGFLVIRRATTR